MCHWNKKHTMVIFYCVFRLSFFNNRPNLRQYYIDFLLRTSYNTPYSKGTNQYDIMVFLILNSAKHNLDNRNQLSLLFIKWNRFHIFRSPDNFRWSVIKSAIILFLLKPFNENSLEKLIPGYRWKTEFDKKQKAKLN